MLYLRLAAKTGRGRAAARGAVTAGRIVIDATPQALTRNRDGSGGDRARRSLPPRWTQAVSTTHTGIHIVQRLTLPSLARVVITDSDRIRPVDINTVRRAAILSTIEAMDFVIAAAREVRSDSPGRAPV